VVGIQACHLQTSHSPSMCFLERPLILDEKNIDILEVQGAPRPILLAPVEGRWSFCSPRFLCRAIGRCFQMSGFGGTTRYRAVATARYLQIRSYESNGRFWRTKDEGGQLDQYSKGLIGTFPTWEMPALRTAADTALMADWRLDSSWLRSPEVRCGAVQCSAQWLRADTKVVL
jgi:hypothetical protein